MILYNSMRQSEKQISWVSQIENETAGMRKIAVLGADCVGKMGMQVQPTFSASACGDIWRYACTHAHESMGM